MLAQKTEPHIPKITAIDVDPEAIEEACENFFHSPWNDRLKGLCSSVQTYRPHDRYDLIITNPPYFPNGKITADPKLAQARSTITLSHEDLIQAVLNLLSEHGRFALILPVAESMRFQSLAQAAGLGLNRICRVHSIPGDGHEVRHLMEFSRKHSEEPIEESLVIENGIRHHYSDAFKKLTKDFYLPSTLDHC